MSRSVALLAVVPWVVALGSVLAVRWQTRRALAEMDTMTLATRAEINRGFAAGLAAMAQARAPRRGEGPEEDTSAHE